MKVLLILLENNFERITKEVIIIKEKKIPDFCRKIARFTGGDNSKMDIQIYLIEEKKAKLIEVGCAVDSRNCEYILKKLKEKEKYCKEAEELFKEEWKVETCAMVVSASGLILKESEESFRKIIEGLNIEGRRKVVKEILQRCGKVALEGSKEIWNKRCEINRKATCEE